MRHCRTDGPTARYEPSATKLWKNESDEWRRREGGNIEGEFTMHYGMACHILHYVTRNISNCLASPTEEAKKAKHSEFVAKCNLYTRQKRLTPKAKPKRRKQAVLPGAKGQENT